jgi:NAD(P)-dependent dehydrogenase (short-subunit alcohol dehydrogenase family)
MTNLFDLTGTVSVVSGASGWLGVAMVDALASHGSTVVAVSRREDRLSAALTGIRGDLHLHAADVTTSQWPAALAEIAERFGRIDTLVNNAHVGRGGSLRLSEPADYREAMELAVVAAAEGMKAATPGLEVAASTGGVPSIINVSSMYGLVSPVPGMYDLEEGRNPPYYGAAKAALAQLTRYAAAELGPRGIRVNAVAPGPFPGIAAHQDDAFSHKLAERTMLQRIGQPTELAGVIVFLASRAASFVSGATLPVDGGWTAW